MTSVMKTQAEKVSLKLHTLCLCVNYKKRISFGMINYKENVCVDEVLKGVPSSPFK